MRALAASNDADTVTVVEAVPVPVVEVPVPVPVVGAVAAVAATRRGGDMRSGAACSAATGVGTCGEAVDRVLRAEGGA